MSTLTFAAKDCPVTAVTVFSDRAEVTRKLEVKPDAVPSAGTHTLVINGLSPSLQSHSVRLRGVGECIIEEVSNELKKVEIDHVKEEKTEIDQLLKQMEHLLKRLHENTGEEEGRKQRGELVRQYVESMLTGTTGGKFGKGAAPGPAAAVQEGGTTKVDELLKYYAKNQSEIVEMSFKSKTERDKIESELRVVKERLDALVPGIPQLGEKDKLLNCVQGLQNNPSKRGGAHLLLASRAEVTVLVTINADGLKQHQTSAKPFVFEISYLVRNASWRPAYDFRIATEQTKIKLSYFGYVQQKTEEDWNDVKLMLSTAQPSIGGTPPPLPTKSVDFMQEHAAANFHAERGFSGAALFGSAAPPSGRSMAKCSRIPGPAVPPQMMMEQRTAQVTSSAGAANATFEIQRAWTVESDNIPHKVTIAMVELDSEFRHFAVPSLRSDVFLQAKTKNTSDLTLLPSGSCSIFLDGTYLTNTSIDAVAPGEVFSSFLGVDPSVRIESHNKTKLKKETGFVMAKGKRLDIVCRTVVYNTKPSTRATLVIAQQLPLSADDKIKVKLLTPAENVKEVAVPKDENAVDELPPLQPSETFCNILNKTTNNLLFLRTVEPATKIKTELSYSVEWPLDKEIVL